MLELFLRSLPHLLALACFELPTWLQAESKRQSEALCYKPPASPGSRSVDLSRCSCLESVSVFLRSILHVFGSGAAVRTRAQELKQRRKKADFLNIPTKIRRCFLLFVAWRLRTGSSGAQLHLGVCLGVPELVPPTCVWHEVRARR